MSVSVVVALYNGERFIEKQLDCIRNQSVKVDRVVLCDDGSKDNTFEIVSKYIEKYDLKNTWNLVKNVNNLGYIKNFYNGISLTEEDYVFLSDQDDVWELDKIEQMCKVMEENPSINLLSCKCGIIDSDGNPIRTMLSNKSTDTNAIKSISVHDIMIGYHWPGMAMCIRKDFFDSIYDSIAQQKIPHDLAFTICAADINSFYEFDYIGAYHRRHDNNVAREEHRIFQLLKMDRKLKDVEEMIKTLDYVVDAKLNIEEESTKYILEKREYLKKRRQNLLNGKLKDVFSLKSQDKFGFYTKNAFICDLWLVIFKK